MAKTPALNHNRNRPTTRNRWVGAANKAVVVEAAEVAKVSAKVIAIIVTTDAVVGTSADADSVVAAVVAEAAKASNSSVVSHAHRSHQ